MLKVLDLLDNIRSGSQELLKHRADHIRLLSRKKCDHLTGKRVIGVQQISRLGQGFLQHFCKIRALWIPVLLEALDCPPLIRFFRKPGGKGFLVLADNTTDGIGRQLPRCHIQNPIIFEREIGIPEIFDFPTVIYISFQLTPGFQFNPQCCKNILTAHIAVDDREGKRF